MRKRRAFKSTTFCEITDDLKNPFRGWYRIYSFCAEKSPDLSELIWCLNENETCVMVIIDIAAYQAREIDETAVSNIESILNFFDEQKKDVLLRIVYDREGKGPEHEPPLLSIVLGHIEKLGPVIQKYRDRIVFYEGMLVGNWGEMHGSKFLSQKNMRTLNDALEKSAAGVIRAVRRPVQWRMLHDAMPDKGSTVALFNDAIFGSETDLGTYADKSNTGGEKWDEPWDIAREMEFEEVLGEYLPQCGEAVYGEAYEKYDLGSTVLRLKKMHLTALNSTYDERILNIWKKWRREGKDIWRGISGYDYIGRHLGYRFFVKSAAVRFTADYASVTLSVENVGFSGFYQEGEARLLLVDKSEQINEYLTGWDIREWKSGKSVSLTWQIPIFPGKLYLSVRRKWDKCVIRFANPSSGDGWIYLGELFEE